MVLGDKGLGVGTYRHVHWFLGDKGLDIQQGTSVCIGLPKSRRSDLVGKINHYRPMSVTNLVSAQSQISHHPSLGRVILIIVNFLLACVIEVG